MGSEQSAPQRTFKAIPDQYETYEELQLALRKAGLESSNLVVGIDFTKSNEWTGEKSFQGKCLHTIDHSGNIWNPYQSVIHVMGQTLEAFDDDKIIPAFGFGDTSTGGKSCFRLSPNILDCAGFQRVLECYNAVTPRLTLSGPTNFAPIINETINIVKREKSYHILVIIADGQVTSERETVEAIVYASKYPISIIMVGVGDGPWHTMEEFDDNLPQRTFDNFQFVEYSKVLKFNKRSPEVGFATAAMMEIPDQYKEIRKLGLL